MLIVTMANQYRAPDMSRSSTNRDYCRLGCDRAGVPQLRHVPASVCALLYMRDMGTVGRVRRTCMGRFRESSGGQTKDQSKINAAFMKASVHRVLSSRNHGLKKMIRAPKGVLK
jgi:hypothetical protein